VASVVLSEACMYPERSEELLFDSRGEPQRAAANNKKAVTTL